MIGLGGAFSGTEGHTSPHPDIFPRRQRRCESFSSRQPNLCPLFCLSTGGES